MSKKHKHYKEIIAWAEGKEILFKGKYSRDWKKANIPSWDENVEYMVKPLELEAKAHYIYPCGDQSLLVIHVDETPEMTYPVKTHTGYFFTMDGWQYVTEAGMRLELDKGIPAPDYIVDMIGYVGKSVISAAIDTHLTALLQS